MTRFHDPLQQLSCRTTMATTTSTVIHSRVLTFRIFYIDSANGTSNANRVLSSLFICITQLRSIRPIYCHHRTRFANSCLIWVPGFGRGFRRWGAEFRIRTRCRRGQGRGDPGSCDDRAARGTHRRPVCTARARRALHLPLPAAMEPSPASFPCSPPIRWDGSSTLPVRPIPRIAGGSPSPNPTSEPRSGFFPASRDSTSHIPPRFPLSPNRLRSDDGDSEGGLEEVVRGAEWRERVLERDAIHVNGLP
jgi:hypothetical protein